MTDLEKARAEIDACDREMAALFARRMAAVEEVADYKEAAGLPVLDRAREDALLVKNMGYLPDKTYEREYRAFLRAEMAISRGYQSRRRDGLYVDLGDKGYPILLKSGGIYHAKEYLNLNRRVLIVTDDGVPSQYARTVESQCATPTRVCIPAGEQSKKLATYEKLLTILLERGFTRSDCVVAVGGGVVGDLAGFAAATYLRGIDFYNIPTTLLSQVDSSVGGKTGVDFREVKNQVGAFWQPKAVLIDPDTLSTLAPRQVSNGMAEVIKMAATSDPALFSLAETASRADIPALIRGALLVKKSVVEQDAEEAGLRRVLNFGHTVGHAIESLAAPRLLHGECVALGMLPFSSPAVRERLKAVYARYGLPCEIPFSPEQLMPLILHDKKNADGGITCVTVEEIGKFSFRKVTPDEMLAFLKGGLPQ